MASPRVQPHPSSPPLPIRPGVLLLTASLAAAAGGVAAARASLHGAVLAGVAVVTLAQWVGLQRASMQVVPLAGVVIAGVNSVGALGYLYYPSIADRAAVSAAVPETHPVYALSASIFATASAGLFLGGLLTGRRAGVPPPPTLQTVRAAGARVKPGVLAAVAGVPLLLETIAYTPAGLLSRGHYGAFVGPQPVVIAGSVLAPVGATLAALLWVRADSPRSGASGAGLLGCYVLLLYSMGTRQLALVPVMTLLVWLLIRGRDAGKAHLVAVAVVASAVTVLFLQLPLTMRAATQVAGFLPYTALLMGRPSLLVAFDFPRIFGNVLFSFPLAGTVALGDPFPLHYLGTSISPAPASMTDWADIKMAIRLNRYTPANGLGELRNYGVAYLAGFTVAVGACLTAVQRGNARLPAGRAALASVIGMGLTGAITYNLLQYNLRTSTRDLWYLLAITGLLHVTGRRPAGSPLQADHR